MIEVSEWCIPVTGDSSFTARNYYLLCGMYLCHQSGGIVDATDEELSAMLWVEMAWVWLHMTEAEKVSLIERRWA